MNLTAIVSVVVPLLGILIWYFKWKYDPNREFYTLKAEIEKELKKQQRIRDEALKNADIDNLTLSGHAIVELYARRRELFQRFGKNITG